MYKRQVKYVAQAPREWVLEALRDAEREITMEILAEQQRTQEKMAQMLPVLDGDTLHEFLRLKKYCKFISERLM